MRVGNTGDPRIDFKCKKNHTVLGHKKSPLEDEFQTLPHKFSETCLEILKDLGLYTPPGPDELFGIFHHELLEPTRHHGVCHPGSTENMSPVLAEHFAFTRSMQNMQVVTGTNAVSRYIVKVCFFKTVKNGFFCSQIF